MRYRAVIIIIRAILLHPLVFIIGNTAVLLLGFCYHNS